MTDSQLLTLEDRNTTLRRMLNRAQAAALPGLVQGQTFRNMAIVFNDEIQSAYNRVRMAMANGLPSTATGPYLDIIGDALFGLSRQGAIPASADASDKNISFYVNSGSLVDYLTPGADGRGNIPAGTSVSDKNGNTFNTVNDVWILPGDTSVYVSVEARIPGRSGNVPANVLTIHDLDQRVKCTNRFDISNGADVESDRNFRFRIMQAHLASQGGNLSAIRLALAGVPGISDFRITENSNGPGTVEVLLVPVGNRIPTAVKASAQAVVEAVVPATSLVTVREPDYLDFEITVLTSGTSPGVTSGLIRQSAQQAIYGFMSSIGLGGSANLDTMVTALGSRLASFGVVTTKIVCFTLNGQPARIGLVKLGRRNLLTPSPLVAEPVRIITS